MPTAHTQTTIANRALDLIGEFPINDLATETNAYARWVRRNLVHTVQAALRQQPWNFAVELHELSLNPTVPVYRWKYQYDLPPGWLRVLPPTHNGDRGGQPLSHSVMRNKLFMNDNRAGGGALVEIVMDVQNPGEWDPLFADYISARLGTGLAHRFTAKNTFVQACQQAAAEALAIAEEINAFEGSMDTFDQHDIIRVRGNSPGSGSLY